MATGAKRIRGDSSDRPYPAGHSSHLHLDLGTLQAGVESQYPEKYRDYLACPFQKRYPDSYWWRKSACTQGWGFPNIGKLRYSSGPLKAVYSSANSSSEHINRAHNRKFFCADCGYHFKSTKDSKLEQEKRQHAPKCQPEDTSALSDPTQVMSEEQQADWSRLDCRGQGKADGIKWNNIYKVLFGAPHDPTLTPCKSSIGLGQKRR